MLKQVPIGAEKEQPRIRITIGRSDERNGPFLNTTEDEVSR